MTRKLSFIALALVAAAVAAPMAQSVTDPNGKQAVDPLAVSYLQGQGYSPGEIKVLIGQGDPLAVSYLRDQGLSAAQINAMATGQTSQPATRPIDPLAVSYLRNLGMSQAQIEEWTTGVCAQAVRPAVCSLPVSDLGVASTEPTSSAGFSWSDAGIGAGATLGALLLLAGLGGAFVISRQNRRRHVASA
jgi:hypothetical protein